MPLHFNDLDIISDMDGIRSALIVPCNMCPGVAVSVRENKPFMNIFRRLFTSEPFDEYLKKLQLRLKKKGVKTKVFKSYSYHHWFMCMWSSSRQKKLGQFAKQYDAVVVLGCESAAQTVYDAIKPHNCKVVEGMEVTGIMNARMKFKLSGSLSFDGCKVVPMLKKKRELRLINKAVA